MKSNTVTKALIYESQGYTDDALIIYKNILQTDPKNKDALDAIKRLGGIKKPQENINKDMLELFLSNDNEKIKKFKEWLVNI